MDADRFDAAVRWLTDPPSRRALLGRAAVGLLAALGLASAANDALGKRKKKRKKKKKKCRGCPTCTSCVKGRCQPVPNFTPCGGVCQECQNGQCVNKADNTVCNGDGRCLDGTCNPRPDCISANVGGCNSNPNCCSGECDSGAPSDGVCEQGDAGTPCKVNGDCLSNSCVGYVCEGDL